MPGADGPGRGRNYPPLTMKWLLLAVIAVLVLALSACGRHKSSLTDQTLPPVTTTIATTTTTLPCNDPILPATSSLTATAVTDG